VEKLTRGITVYDLGSVRQQHQGGKNYSQQIELMVASALSSQDLFTGYYALERSF
jgi:hypothetical protein